MVMSTDNDFPNPEALLVAQEISFAKVLAGNDKVRRDRAVKKLRRWLVSKSQSEDSERFTEDDFLRLWKGLFYCMWMSDKMLVQEELAETLSQLIECFNENKQLGLLFIKCFFKIMCIEWNGLDQYRVDKFSMFIRRFLRKTLRYLKTMNWNEAYLQQLNETFLDTVLASTAPIGLALHFINIFPEEMAKVGGNDLSKETVTELLDPFMLALATLNDSRLRHQVLELFKYLIRQTDFGIRYNEKFDAWTKAGCPGGDVNLMTKVKTRQKKRKAISQQIKEEEEEYETGPLDPRAGHVDVALPQIQLDTPQLISKLEFYLLHKAKIVKTKKQMSALVSNLQKLKMGRYPFAMRKIEVEPMVRRKKKILSAAKRLIRLEMNEARGRARREKKARQDSVNVVVELDQDEQEEFNEEELKFLNKVRANAMKAKENKVNKKELKKKKKRGLKDPINGIENGGSPKILKKEINGVAKTEKSPVQHKSLKNSTITNTSPTISKRNDCFAVVPTNGVQTPEHKTFKNLSMGNTSASVSPSSRVILKAKRRSSCTVFEVEDIPTTPVNSTLPSDWQVEDIDKSQNQLSVPDIVPVPKSAVSEGVRDWLVSEKKKESPAKSPTTDVEIVIPFNRTTPDTSVRNNIQNVPAFFEKAREKILGKRKLNTPETNVSVASASPSVGKKRISFALDLNESQEDSDYLMKVQTSTLTPFDSTKKPKQSALKPGLLATPMNPFARYGKKSKDFIKI